MEKWSGSRGVRLAGVKDPDVELNHVGGEAVVGRSTFLVATT